MCHRFQPGPARSPATSACSTRHEATREGFAAEVRLSDLRDWEKAAKLFFSALKNANASTRAALCKDPEGAIEKLMEGQTVEKVTGEQAQEDAQQ